MNRKLLVLPAVVGLMAPALAGCGSSSDSTGSSATIVVGTTDIVQATKDSGAPLDPAAAYDVGEWNILQNVFQTLLSYPRSGTQPVPDAAKDCGFTDKVGETFRCTMRGDLEFSNGDPLTAADVKFSIDRMVQINDPNGPSSLFDNVDRVETPTDDTVVFHLKSPDATFPDKLATPAGSIVDSKVYSKTAVRNGYDVTGSGPYTLDSFNAGDTAVFSKNSHYSGAFTVNNSKIEMRFFKDSNAMEAALKAGTIDVTGRTLTPDQIAGLDKDASQNINVTEAPGMEIRYLGFNTNDPSVRNVAVRRAIAQVVDRQALVRDVYARTSQPLYSMVPQGITGHINSFFNEYGNPDPAAARTTLDKAGISTPVALTMTYTTDHYGAATAQEFTELKKQLESSGLFTVTLQGQPWATFRPAEEKNQFSVYGMGWFPDFPDPDNFVAPFFGKDNILGSPYRNPSIENQLLPATRQDAERSAAVPQFQQIQDDVARDVPLLPLWQGKQYLAARADITGTEWALNASSELQMWELGRGVRPN